MIDDILIVAASVVSEDLFSRATYLGRSLQCFPEEERPAVRLTADNGGSAANGLPDIYNEAIRLASPDTILLMVHDDVYIHDWFLAHRLRQALTHFDVVGLAGSSNPDLSQPSWGLAFDEDLKPVGWQDDLDRSGCVNHFDYSHPDPSWYGNSGRACELVDGLFLAVNAGVVQRAGVQFDPDFAFHFYDLDFCRSATAAGLRLGTWPIAVTHDSGGGFQTDIFRVAARRYLAKWG